MERERQLKERINNVSQPNNTDQQADKAGGKNYLGLKIEDINRIGVNIPGFQLIKDRVIKPLVVATEKYVEYYLKEDGEQN